MARPNSEDEEMRPMPFQESKIVPDLSYVSRKLTKKTVVLVVSVVGFIACIILAYTYGLDYSLLDHGIEATGFANVSDLSTFREQSSKCGRRDEIADMDIWNEAVEKSSHLIQDKFTIALQTYQRPAQLNETLQHLTENKIPSLHEIVIVWNDLETEPPVDYVSEFNVTVRFRRSEENSLNQKLLPDPKYATQGVLLSDDDWNYNTTDLEFVFQHWRRHGMHRLTGAFARCYYYDKNGDPVYDLCNNKAPKYQMVLTGLTFTHMSFLEYYHSEDPLMRSVRDYIDDKFNCEDIALNYVQSMLTCEGPLQVFGLVKLDHQAAKHGISSKPGHMGRRSRCLKDFKDMFGYMPLHDVDTYLRRGVISVS
ncbi:hypothetical protein F66182_1200 [Fusarium sp. NRRL 66182]|nr:hypothetical protein F66182_1200 [Fusarium sp. NRRL 66182]